MRTSRWSTPTRSHFSSKWARRLRNCPSPEPRKRPEPRFKRTDMRFPNCILCLLATCTLAAYAQTKRPLVEFELMTWPEVKKAQQEGKTTALIFNGGTEQRGPLGVNGAHTLIGRVLAREIALRLGNAIVAPILPYSVNRANPELPGTIGITGPLFAALN